jgi:hypothetical protein
MEISRQYMYETDLKAMNSGELRENVEALQDISDDIRSEDCRNCGRPFLSVEGSRYCDRDCEMGWRKFVPFEERHQ